MPFFPSNTIHAYVLTSVLIQNGMTIRRTSTCDARGTRSRGSRFNRAGLLGPTGAAQDGEVEDYKVSIARFFEPQPGSPAGGVKASQPPKQSNANSPYAFNGWDEPSSLHLHQIVADDWQCTDQQPVTGFRWWGSFEGWTKPLRLLWEDSKGPLTSLKRIFL
jgi:hypothetical protein